MVLPVLSGIVSLYHVFKFNLILNAISHGGLTISIVKGFLISLFQCATAHPISVAVIAATFYIFKGTVYIFIAPKDGAFSGIINHFQNKTNFQLLNEIDIFSTGCYSKNNKYQPLNIALFNDTTKYYLSKNSKDNWIQFDFKDYIVIPISYTIKTINSTKIKWFPKSWVLEGSKNLTTWTILDEEANCTELNGPGLNKTFGMSKQPWKFFRYIRLRLNGTDWSNKSYYLGIDAFELYGGMISKKGIFKYFSKKPDK